MRPSRIDDGLELVIPDYIRAVVENIAFVAREDSKIDKRSKWVRAFKEPAALVTCDPPKGQRAIVAFLILLSDFGDAPATLRLILGDDVPRFMGAKKMSMHQAGFQEVLSSAELSGELPASLALVGVQPALLDDYGGSLTPGVKAQIEPAIDLACEVLADWGIQVTRREKPPVNDDLIGPGALEMGDYEEGRPIIAGDNR